MGNAKRGIGAKSLAWTILMSSAATIALTGCGGTSGSDATGVTSSSTDSGTSALASSGSSSSSSSSDSSSSSSSSSSGSTSSGGSSSSGSSGTASPTVTLTWDVPTQRTDGTNLTDLAGYTIHYGTSSGNYTQTIKVANPGLTTYVVDNLATGTYYFTLTAYDSSGNQSTMSGETSAAVAN